MSTNTLAIEVIGDNVMFGPKVTFHGGNHNIDLCDIPMRSAHYKPERDKGIVIEDDFWIGANVTF